MDIIKKKAACIHFAIYGGLWGVLAPLLLVTGFHAVFYPITNNGDVIMVLIILLVVSSPGAPLVAYIIYDNPKIKKFGDIFLYLAGFFTMILVGPIVYYTGGMSHSIFAFFFFFFPSAIAIAFEASTGLLIVCVTSFITVSTNLYAEKVYSQVQQQATYETTEYFILYILFVAVHLTAIYFLETKSIKRSS